MQRIQITCKSVPEDDTEELNGQMCQTCMPADSDWCESTKAIDCTGHENRCLLVTKTEDNVTLIGSLSGCVTNSICDYYNDPENEIAEEGVEYTCSDGSLDLRICLYLPAAACLLILTLLL
ncbi:urokinase plasminogen activator surface receptor-like [Hyperolius riggenbachi]|uniref:urokinase plasminogen activator surface receptor-like n=1 Tax=Hyperolius riggenbachi TaxID=752182 RepID=UPI0035A3061D